MTSEQSINLVDMSGVSSALARTSPGTTIIPMCNRDLGMWSPQGESVHGAVSILETEASTMSQV
eukprot:2138092-Amphidinium_carterae.1